MANEFAHYEGAQGPEGTRRTTTYYGPVIGGLPIEAWHCPSCGLLRLTYPDGRSDERRLYPGRQAGLIAEASTVSPEFAHFGLQPRVSGITVSAQLLKQAAADSPTAPRRTIREAIGLPALDAVTWTIVLALSALVLGLLIAGVMATYDWTTPDNLGPFVAALAAGFGVIVLLMIGAAVWRQYGPEAPLTPSLAVTGRHKPPIDGATGFIIALLVLTIIGAFVAATLAVYDWTTPDAESAVVIGTLVCAALAILVLIGDGIARRFTSR